MLESAVQKGFYDAGVNRIRKAVPPPATESSCWLTGGSVKRVVSGERHCPHNVFCYFKNAFAKTV